MISIIMPVYNGERFVADAIGSILMQTIAEWELIVVNDGSTDGTQAVLERFAGDPRIRLLRKENGGVSSARNAGIAAATGEYLAFLDADDTWYPDCLETYERLAKAYPQAVLLGAAAREVDDPIRQRVLDQILYHLGRWVYLVDAADDLKKDAASGNYNPVALRFGLTDGIWTAEARREFAATLDHSIHMMATAFELWDFGVWTPILETTFYTGLFHVGKAVLDGTFRTARRGEDRKKSKNVEEST